MSVLRGVARRLVLGLVLAAAFALVPVLPAAADPAAAVSVRAAGLWEAAAEWLAALWGPAVPESDSPAGGGVHAAGVCRGDEGMCIDPNG
jgi:hypothetical protein